MDDQAKPVSRPWRRFLRLSVRGVIFIVLLIGFGLGWVARQTHDQRDAVTAIQAAGGAVQYEWEWKDGVTIKGGRRPTPRWLVDLLGLDFFGHVTAATLQNANNDASIVHFGRLTRLEMLNFDRSFVGDAALTHVKRLTNLTSLGLNGTPVTDAGLGHLCGLTKLGCLRLRDTHVSDDGLAHLKGLRSLFMLVLAHTCITDAGLSHLKRMTELDYLDLSDTDVSDAGLAHLKGLTNLSDLNLNRTFVTDTGEKELKRALPKLRISRSRPRQILPPSPRRRTHTLVQALANLKITR